MKRGSAPPRSRTPAWLSESRRLAGNGHTIHEVTDKALGASRTADYITAIVDSSSVCKGKLMAGALASASVVLQGPAGVAALPAGFASSGVVVAGTASGSSAGAAGAGAAAGGGGLGATGLVLGGAAVAGGAAVVAAKAHDSGGSDTSESTARYQVSFLPSPPGIDASVCGSGSTSITFNAQGVTADKNGAFDIVWSPSTPVLRAVGQVTPTTFSANLACTNGARTGSISATGSNGSYSGTFEFGSSRGQVTVTKS